MPRPTRIAVRLAVLACFVFQVASEDSDKWDQNKAVEQLTPALPRN